MSDESASGALAKPARAVRARPISKSMWILVRILLVLVIMLAWFQRSLIYQPTRSNQLKAATVPQGPSVADIQVTTHDNLVLNGWLALADGPSLPATPDLPALLSPERPLVIIFPGNGGHRGMRCDILQTLGGFGADAIIFDHRGYGDNPGQPTEAQLVRDARTIWTYATESLKVPARRIVLYGESLGGGVAIRLAGDLCTEGQEPGGLIVQSSFNSLVAAGQYHFPVLPVSLVLIDRFDSERHITRVTCPLLQLHGVRDTIVPLSMGEALFKAAPDRSSTGIEKQLVLLPSTDHNDVYFGPDFSLVKTALQSFLGQVVVRNTAPMSERASHK